MGKLLLIGMLLLAYGHQGEAFPWWLWAVAGGMFVWEILRDVEGLGTQAHRVEIQGFEEIYGTQVGHHLRRSLKESAEEEEEAEAPGPARNLSPVRDQTREEKQA